MKFVQENDPNVERSTAVTRGVMSKMACYKVLLKEKQQKKRQAITAFFQADTSKPVMESDTGHCTVQYKEISSLMQCKLRYYIKTVMGE